MTAATVPLQDLALRITQQETELAQLRKEYEARQTKLAELNHRKEELQTQLQQLEMEIQSVGQENPVSAPTAPTIAATPSPAPAPKTTAKPAPKEAAKPMAKTTSKPTETEANGMSLPKFLIHLVSEAAHPITVKELAQEVVNRKFPSKSKDLPGMVETRVSELIKRGLLERTADKTALVAPSTTTSTSTTVPATPAPAAAPSTPKATPAPTPASAAPSTPAATTGRAPSLKQLLMDVLSESDHPLKTSELAEKVLARGYTTTSKDFKNVIWVCIGDLEGVKNIRGQGYLLKKSKSTASKK